MATAFVQAANFTDPSSGISSLASPASKAFGSNIVAGSVIVLWIRLSTAATTVTAVSDTLGNTYVDTGFVDATPGGTPLRGWLAKNVVGGACTVTVTAGSNIRAQMEEVSGCDLVAPLDKVSAAAHGTSTTPTSASITPSVNGAFLSSGVTSDGAIGTVTAGSGYTIRKLGADLATDIEDQVQTSAAAITAGYSVLASIGWCAGLISLKPLPVFVGAGVAGSRGFGSSSMSGGRRYRASHIFDRSSGLWLTSPR